MSNLRKWVFSWPTLVIIVVSAIVFGCIAACNHDSRPPQSNPTTTNSNSNNSRAKVPPGPPATSIDANPRSVEKGKTVTITWKTDNVSDVTLEGVDKDPQKVDASGSLDLAPSDSTTYRLIATALLDGRRIEASVPIIVVPPLPDPKKDLNDAVHSTNGNYNGTPYQINLFWDSYCNTQIWGEMVQHNLPDGAKNAVYDGMSRLQKDAQIAKDFVAYAQDLYRQLLHDDRTKHTDPVMFKNFKDQEKDFCDKPYSEYVS